MEHTEWLSRRVWFGSNAAPPVSPLREQCAWNSSYLHCKKIRLIYDKDCWQHDVSSFCRKYCSKIRCNKKIKSTAKTAGNIALSIVVILGNQKNSSIAYFQNIRQLNVVQLFSRFDGWNNIISWTLEILVFLREESRSCN